MTSERKSRDRYNLTEQDEERAKRLQRIYNRKKVEDGLTQRKLGIAVGISQGSTAKYLGGDIPMNVSMVVKMAKALGVEAREIEPDLDARFTIQTIAASRQITVLGTQSGKQTETRYVIAKGKNTMEHHLAILVDTDALAPVIEEGSTLYVDPRKTPRTGGGAIVVQLRVGSVQIPYRLVDKTDKGIEVTAWMVTPGSRDEYKNPDWFPEKPLFIANEDISAVRVLSQVQFESAA